MPKSTTKTTICPQCGKIENHEEINFDIGLLDGRIKEIDSPKADGLMWCRVCPKR